LLFVVLSCLGWLGYVARSPAYHAWGDLERGTYSDHFSHMNAARAFARIGFDIYRAGARQLLPGLHPALHPLPADLQVGGGSTGGIFLLPGVRADKPWLTGWADRPRLYPPGDLLLVAPVAMLYDQTELSFAAACRLLIALFVLYAHVSLYFVYRWLAPQLKLSTPLLWLCAGLIYFEAVHWSLNGFYDFAVVTPLVFCLRYLQERRAIAAALAYCLAAACHFRVFFLAPLALYALWIFVADKQWRGLKRRDYAALLAVGVLSLGVLWVFALIRPALDMPVTNPAHPSLWAASLEPVLWLLAVSLISLLLLLCARAWFDVVQLAWLSLTLVALNEAAPWHLLAPMTWLIAPLYRGRPEGFEAVRLARLLLLWFAGVWLLRGQFWPEWLFWLWRS
jgi:hypothetical protein